MLDYILEDIGLNEPFYVLIEQEGDFRIIMGASCNLESIEKMISELEAAQNVNENAIYKVIEIEQQADIMGYVSDWAIEKPLKDNCYLVYQGPALEMAERLLGYFDDKQHSVEFAEYAMSFFETEDIFILNAPLDELFDLGELEIGGWDEDEYQITFE